ncbi:MAG: PilN domain-containing protein [Cardiobacteriaceae bacterium]|nr:PilN domain-containing protein [Cardiobacteriaceae bacterium]
MARKFNLQPWRAKKREAQQKVFVSITSILALLVAGVLFGDRYLQKQYVDGQYEAISTLEQEIQGLEQTEQKIQKIKELNDEATRQVQAIDQLQGQRGFVVELMDYLANGIPDTVFLNSITYKASAKTVEIKGYAENDAAVSDFMLAMNKFKYAGVSSLNPSGIVRASNNESFEVADGSEVKEFTVTVPVVYGDEKNAK